MAIELFPYQEEGARFLAARGRAGLFDTMGLGKTAQAIRALDLNNLVRGIIVAPASVCSVWMNEIRKFSDRPRRVLHCRSNDDLNLWMRFRHDVMIVSYERATKFRRYLEKDFYEFLILDEGHMTKSPQAQRTRAIYGHQCDGKFGYGKWAAYVWNLTGTPIPNQPLDIWTWLRFQRATELTYRSFVARYFHEIPGSFASSYKPRKETIPELTSVFYKDNLRRTLEAVSIELPPVWVTTQEVDGDTSAVRALLAEHDGLDKAVREAVNKGGLSFLDAGHIATLRRLVGEAKAPVFAQQLVEELHGGLDKVVVFCEHKQPIATLSAELTRAGIEHVIVDGSTPVWDRGKVVDRFQTDPECRVFIGSSAAYEGITLTAAAHIVMLEQNWSPAKNAQALKRVHRIGQQRAVHARIIALAKSIDADVAATVARKTQQIVAVQGSDI